MQAAQAALTHYPIQVDSIEFVGQHANSVFKVVDVHNNTYSLRFHESRSETLEELWTNHAAIHSEMLWLQTLSNESDLTVPIPYKNRYSEYVSTVNGVHCTLIGWVKGEQKPFIPTAEDAGHVGQMIGKLHKQASSWTTPEPFSRPSFDEYRIAQSLKKIKALTEAGKINKQSSNLLIAAGERAIDMMNTLERTNTSWGIIHADLIPSNILFDNHEARPIDFGACGFGYFLFDLGWAFSYIHPSFRYKLLEKYSNVFSLPDNHVELLEGFFVAAQLDTINFWIGLPDAFQWLPSHIDKLAAREFKSYADQEPFLFTGTPYWE